MKKLTDLLDIRYPVIVAPMFLISNTRMIKEALDMGVTAAFPALNYRTDAALREAIADIRKHTTKPFGVNLIVNKSNPTYPSQLKTLVSLKVDFIITSLGSPEETIRQAHAAGIKVFCDVTDAKYAKKVASLGADAVIAVNNMAGGHAGNLSAEELLTSIQDVCDIPIISAGGIGTGQQLANVMTAGAAGASIGTIFIACTEAEISPEYKQAMVDYGAKDIVRTTKLSGSALTVINTPYVQKLGTRANLLEWIILRNKTLKKYAKMILALRGMKAIEKAAFGATYKSVWCAGPAIEYVQQIRPIREILVQLIREYESASISPSPSAVK